MAAATTTTASAARLWPENVLIPYAVIAPTSARATAIMTASVTARCSLTRSAPRQPGAVELVAALVPLPVGIGPGAAVQVRVPPPVDPGERVPQHRLQVAQRAVPGEDADLLLARPPHRGVVVVDPPGRAHAVLLGPVLLPGDVDGSLAAGVPGEAQPPHRVVSEELVQLEALLPGHAPEHRR